MNIENLCDQEKDSEYRNPNITKNLIIEELLKTEKIDLDTLHERVFRKDWISSFDFCDSINAMREKGIIYVNVETMMANLSL
jgi:hypothetical protein